MDEGRPGVLLIDDEQDIVRTFTLFLEKFGYTVDSARNGLEAVEKLSENTYEAVISRLGSPETPGREEDEGS